MSASNTISFDDQRRIRMVLKRAQEVLSDSYPPTYDEMLAVLCVLFRDPELIAASERGHDRLSVAVREIRSILASRLGRASLVNSKHVIDVLRHDSALSAPWLRKVLGEGRLGSARGERQQNRPHNEAS
jgi:hypothetical protein